MLSPSSRSRPTVLAREITGWSLGGYLALRAASGEHRLAACVADPGLYSIASGMEGRMAAAGVPSEAVESYPDIPESVLAPIAAAIHADRPSAGRSNSAASGCTA